MKPLLYWGVELRLWVALCVASLGRFAREFLQNMHGPTPHFASVPEFRILFFATLCLYNLDGTLDRPRLADRNRRKVHLALTCVAGAGLVESLSASPWPVIAYITCGFFACAVYALPLLRGRAVKSLPGLKAPFVGTAVSCACVGLPALALHLENETTDARVVGQSAILLLILAAYCTANALLFDVPDVAEDRAFGVPTVASLQGIKSTQIQSCALCAFGMLLSQLLFLGGSDVLVFAVSSTLLGFVLLLCALLVGETTRKQEIAWYVDGSLMLPWLVVWAMSQRNALPPS